MTALAAVGRPVPLPETNRSTAVHASLRPLRPFLDEPDAIEVVVNAPGEVWVETRGGWTVRPAPGVTFDAMRALATSVATLTMQMTGEKQPVLSATLPTGERIQIVQPPATKPGVIAAALRRPSQQVRTLSELSSSGSSPR